MYVMNCSPFQRHPEVKFNDVKLLTRVYKHSVSYSGSLRGCWRQKIPTQTYDKEIIPWQHYIPPENN